MSADKNETELSRRYGAEGVAREKARETRTGPRRLVCMVAVLSSSSQQKRIFVARYFHACMHAYVDRPTIDRSVSLHVWLLVVYGCFELRPSFILHQASF
jgi:hypothetical protein